MTEAGSKDSSFNILGSEKLNTPSGANPVKQPLKDETKDAALGSGQIHSDDHHKKCMAAHNALEDKLRESERLARWKRQ